MLTPKLLWSPYQTQEGQCGTKNATKLGDIPPILSNHYSHTRFFTGAMGIRKLVAEFYDQYYDIIELSDFSIPTFLALGAVFQLVTLAFCGPRIGAILPVAWLVFRLVKAVIATRGLEEKSFGNPTFGVPSVEEV